MIVGVWIVIWTFLSLTKSWSGYRAVKHSKVAYDSKIKEEMVDHVVDLHETSSKMIGANQPLKSIPSTELKRAARLFQAGIPDRWTSNGDLIRGHAPDAATSIAAYDELMNRGEVDILPDFSALLEHGVAGQEDLVDRRKAFELNRMRLDFLNDPYERYGVLESVERLSDLPWQIREAQTLKPEIMNDIAFAAIERVAKNAARRPPIGTVLGTAAIDFPTRVARARRHETQPVAANAGLDGRQRDDLQNSHDSGVVRTVNVSVKNLQNILGPEDRRQYDTVASLRQVRDSINDSAVSDDKKNSAIQALDTIERNNELLTGAGIHEVDLINLVWNRVHHEDNTTNQQALRENLIDELSGCVEHGASVCASGRFNRIIGSLNGADEKVDIKPEWATKQELINKAGVLYKEHIQKLAEEERIALEAIDPTEPQQQMASRLAVDIKDNIRNDFKQAYVDSGVMSQEKLDVELSKWIDDVI